MKSGREVGKDYLKILEDCRYFYSFESVQSGSEGILAVRLQIILPERASFKLVG